LEVREDKIPKLQCTTHGEKNTKAIWNTAIPKYREAMKTLEDKWLTHLVKEGRQPRGTVINTKNQKTLFQVLKEAFVHPKCKRILMEHECSMNMTFLWDSLWTTIDSMIMDQNDIHDSGAPIHVHPCAQRNLERNPDVILVAMAGTRLCVFPY
jgi:hypothetical protein